MKTNLKSLEFKSKPPIHNKGYFLSLKTDPRVFWYHNTVTTFLLSETPDSFDSQLFYHHHIHITLPLCHLRGKSSVPFRAPYWEETVGHDGSVALICITYLNMEIVITVASVKGLMWPEAEQIRLRKTASLQTGFKCYRLWSSGTNVICLGLLSQKSLTAFKFVHQTQTSTRSCTYALIVYTHPPAADAGPGMCHSAKCSYSLFVKSARMQHQTNLVYKLKINRVDSIKWFGT